MEQEAAPFIAKQGLRRLSPEEVPWPDTLPFVAYKGDVGGMEVVLVWAGKDERYGCNNVATTASTLSTYTAILAFSPQLVISAGTAGGFRSAGAEIGDVFISTKSVFHGRRISGSHHYDEYGFGHYRSPPVEVLARKTGCKLGVVSTSDSLDHTPRDLQMMRNEGTSVKDMEAAAIAWVCQTMRVPFIGVKSVTDLVDGEHATLDEFTANLALASERLQDKLG
jgi:5'-methylthioadenosine nucleosidase